MVSRLRDKFAHQLRMPTRGFLGWTAMQFFKINNGRLEKNAVRLCNIQPHHHVLEIGFGPGIGIEYAASFVRDGPGKICGVDISRYSVEQAFKRCKRDIQNKKVELNLASVVDLPYATDSFDCVFHTNCYYFWPSMRLALQEIHRVMKPGANMITCLDLSLIRKFEERGLAKYGAPDPVKYMVALEMSGFQDVKFKYLSDGDYKFQVIIAHLGEKPAYHYDELEMEEAEAQMAAAAEAKLRQKRLQGDDNVPVKEPVSTSSYL